MYSREKRMKAIELYLQNNKCSSAAIHELGYSNRNLLRRWYKRYLEELKTGVVWDQYTRELFTKEQKETAVKYYLEHGKSNSQTVKMLGYPSRPILWIFRFKNSTIPENMSHSSRMMEPLVR